MIYDLDNIKKDLITLDINQFYLKYILKSNNWYFEEYQHSSGVEQLEKIDCFKEIVSESFGISFHSAQIVGSAKLGVSLSPKKKLKNFVIEAKSNDEKESDIDIAIVSESLFSDIWVKLREGRKSYGIPYYHSITDSIFLGYINDKYFKDLEFMRKEWNEKISNSNIKLQNNLSIIHPISYRIYRNWEDLQDYQLKGVRELKERIIKNEI